jgi:hypothetical protein
MRFYSEPVPESVRTLDAILRARVASAPTEAELVFWLALAGRAKKMIVAAPRGEIEAVAAEVLRELQWAAA